MPFKTVKNSNNDTKSWRSLHALVMFGKETARFDIKPSGNDDVDKKNQEYIGQSYRIDNDKLPPTFQNLKPGTLVEDVYVLMDMKNNKAISINPWEGVFDAIAYELGSSKTGRDDNNRPQPDLLSAEETGYNKDIYKFWCAYEIQDDPEFAGIFKGAKPRYHMNLALVDDGHGMAGSDGPAFYKGRQTRTGQFLEWTSVHGIDEDMEWPVDDNPLPELENRLLAKSTPVRIHIEKGWISRVSKARGAAVRVVEDEEPAEKPGLTDPTFGD